MRFGPRPVRHPSARVAAARTFFEPRMPRVEVGATMAVELPEQGQAMESEYRPVIDFWFRELTPRQWFTAGGTELDELIRTRFGAQVEAARRGALDHWAASPRGRLALIILLDQFPRHVYRNTPDAYASDAKALALAKQGIELRLDEQLTLAEQQFFYLPLMHAEDKGVQALSVERFTALRDAAEAVLGFALGHRDVVDRFGRFPHRNEVLGRASSADEKAFLASGENTLR
jgi:uncharacterized protein (DUF924 family)